MGKKKGTVGGIREKVFGRAGDDKSFFLADGRILHHLNELAQSFQDMSNDVFVRHLAGGDFSNWTRDVIGDNELADQLNAARTQVDAEVVVLRRIADRIGGI
jgi:hypothetical protein